MVNIRTSKKRKSNYNSSRSRLSRRIKRGGAWFNNDTILNEKQYLDVYNELITTYKLTDDDINTNTFAANDGERQIIYGLLARLNDYKPQRLEAYKELLKECVPVSPYAREETDDDRKSIKFKEQEAERERKRITYSERDYIGPVSIVPSGYGPEYML